MEVIEGYKYTEAGIIPEDWNAYRLGDLIRLKNGYAFSSSFFSDKGAIVITPGNFMIDGGLNFSNDNTLHYNGDYSSEMCFTKGDLLMVMTDLTPNCNLLGKSGTVESNDVILHNQRIGKIIPKSNQISKIFLQYYFNSFLYSRRMKSTATGSTVRHTSVPTITNTIIPLPPLPEQQAIAEVLSDTDNLIQALEKQIAKKRLIKQGVMQELLTPKEGWVKKRLGEIMKMKHGKSQKGVENINGKYPILGTGGVLGHTNEFLYDKPSVLIGRKGTIDKPQLMESPFWTVDTLFYSEIVEGNDAKFIFYLFNQINWSSYNEASGVPSLNAKTIENIEKGCPSLYEQSRIATILSDMDNKIKKLECKLTKTKQLKQGLMQQLLTGKIRLIES